MLKRYSSIDELKLMLDLYPSQKKEILKETCGRMFKFNNADAWFAVAEDGNCALFKEDGELDDLSKVIQITEDMVMPYGTSLKKIIIPENVKSIGLESFSYFEELEEIAFPPDLKTIGFEAFHHCQSLYEIDLPDSLQCICGQAFMMCTELLEVKFGNGLVSIGLDAFGECISLEKIVIPSSVEEIGERAFAECNSLKEILFKGKTEWQARKMPAYPFGIDLLKTNIKYEP